MPVISNYSTLVSAVTETAEDDSVEFASYIPTAIDLAEQKLAKEMDTLGLILEANVTVSANTPYVSKPSGFRVPHEVYFTNASSGRVTLLDKKTKSYILDYWPIPTSVGTPQYYADRDNSQIIVAPTPDTSYVYTFSYAGRPTALTSANPTNYFTEYCSDALFYATMVEQCRFSRNSMLLDKYKVAYTESIQTLVNEARRQRRDGGSTPRNPEGGQNTLVDGSH